uniref:Uncharacterized protein n=4 Tax=Triticinae TaxID=1648030 RepID=A0A453FGL9_AEGTS
VKALPHSKLQTWPNTKPQNPVVAKFHFAPAACSNSNKKLLLEEMEGDEIFASLDSLWFHSSVLHRRPRFKQHSEELKPPRNQDQHPKCVDDEVTLGARRADPGSRALQERIETWQEEQWRQQTLVVAAPPRCSPVSDGVAMKAHLRSWAHAVACSVR